ncbi:ABC transporter ATP-binding protein [Methylibium petroleiphilum]|uniref:ABC transporter ATP-binding protein n=1 Tax=Methylibium petroleiphilum TaxID=105560 RepID=UPI00041321A7|nr:ABC transporter ATP-binding protein [Methylibium petroleiphilum]
MAMRCGPAGATPSRAMAATATQGFAEAAAHTLSGGERARLLLAGEPQVVLADESLAALDAAHQLRVLALLRQQSHGGRAVALVLHDLALAARSCTRIAVLHQGRLLADGPPAQVLDEALIARAFGVSALRIDHAGETCLLAWQPLPADSHLETTP